MRFIGAVAILPLCTAYSLPSLRAPSAGQRCAAPLLEVSDAAAATMPPNSFLQLLDEAAASTEAAIADGQRLMEIEFPPVPVSKLDDSYF